MKARIDYTLLMNIRRQKKQIAEANSKIVRIYYDDIYHTYFHVKELKQGAIVHAQLPPTNTDGREPIVINL
jgi:hypothetical protein